jgi:nucleoside-diphosphate-sugar epimerase
MRVVVVGATGNVGSSLVRLLAADSRVDSVTGVARRRPRLELPKTTWVVADIAEDDLDPVLREADVAVHLAWLIQPSHDGAALRRVNVDGSARLFDAVARVGVPALVYASSVGAYSPGPKDRFVDESWPTEGVRTSFYSRHKVEVERLLDAFEAAHPGVRVARLRPGLIFKRSAAAGIRRLFVGPFLPGSAVRPAFVPFVPDVPGLRAQAVHADDVAAAYLEAILRDARGAYNVAAPPPLDATVAARLLQARRVRVPASLARSVVGVTWQLHLHPTPPGWVDLGLAVPLMDTRRAREELGWQPQHTAEDALRELLEGLREGAGESTPPLARRSGGRLRSREISTGVGERGDA